MSRLYLLVPVITLLWEVLLILLVTFAWYVGLSLSQSELTLQAAKQARERIRTDLPSSLPHRSVCHWDLRVLHCPNSPRPRVGRHFVVPPRHDRHYLLASHCFHHKCPRIADDTRSTTVHTLLHELVRLSTLPLIVPSPTSGFHSSYYLGLGWGVAEAAWGIVQGWDQLALYEDVMRPSDVEESRETSSKGERRILLLQEEPVDGGVTDEVEGGDGAVVEETELDEAELERKVEILENMRARRGARGSNWTQRLC